MQPGVERRGAGRGGKEEGAQCHPQGTWPGSPCFTLDCAAQDPKGNWKAKRESSNIEATLPMQPRG